MKTKFLLPLALCALSAAAQTQIHPYVPGQTQEGITYFLPQTALQVVVTAKRTVYEPGEYALYAERFLRLTDVVLEKEERWQLQSIAISTYGVADTAHAYSIVHDVRTPAPFVRLAPDGRLLAINTQPLELEEMEEPSVMEIKEAQVDAQDFKTRDVLSAGSKLKMAELTANEIYDIRENRTLLVKGQADFMPTDGEQLRLMLATLDKQEAALLQLFKGSSKSEMHTFVLNYLPSKDGVTHDILFRFSDFMGLVDDDNLAGEPYYIDVRDLKTLPAVKPINPADKKALKKAQQIQQIGLRYLLPGTAEIKIYNALNVLATLQAPFAQFGRVEHLGGDLFNKKMQTSVQLSPTTGGLVNLDMVMPTGK
jgi:hypothetical protein